MPAAQDRLEDSLPEAAERTDDAGLPRFVEQELREFLTCGVRARKGGQRCTRRGQRWWHLCNHRASDWGMSTLHVRNVPEPIHRALQKLARESRSSLSAETIRLLGQALRVDRPGIRELLGEIERTRPRARRGAPAAADLIREDRARR